MDATNETARNEELKDVLKYLRTRARSAGLAGDSSAEFELNEVIREMADGEHRGMNDAKLVRFDHVTNRFVDVKEEG